MRSLTSLGIGLGLVFGCLLLALVAELYYLLWWKKRINHREIEDDYSTSSREFSYLFCWKKPSSLSSTALNPEQLCHSMRIMDPLGHHESADTLQSNSSKDFLLKPFGEDTIEAELIRLHNLAGPPRFLFTIKEETKEDLEAEDRSRKGSRSLADLLVAVETPFLTPLSSPPVFNHSPLTPINCHRQHGFNPLFESSSDAEMNRRISSPPPKFKFMKDAEDKLYRRILMEEAEKRLQQRVQSVEDVHNISVTSSPIPSMVKDEEENGSFVTITVEKNKDEEEHDHLHEHVVVVVPQHHSTSSQVLPLSSSPSTTTTIRTSNNLN